MKVFIGGMSAECNEHVSKKIQMNDIHMLYGEACTNALNIRPVFEDAGIGMIGGVYAQAGPTGMISREAFSAPTASRM